MSEHLAISKARPLELRMARRLVAYSLLALIIVLAIGLRVWLGIDTDVSWMITVNEKLLAGGHLYVDAMETNPPAAVFVYWPPVAFAQATGLRPEWIVDAYVFILAAVSIGIMRRVLHGTDVGNRLDIFSVAAAAILLLLPAVAFGQREHIAVIALLPLFAVLARRAEEQDCIPVVCVVAGVSAAFAMAIKPHFAAIVVCSLVSVIVRTRRPLLAFGLETWTAGALVLVYGALTWVHYPEYFTDIVPMMRDVYARNRVPLVLMLQQPATVFLPALAAIVFVLRRPQVPALTIVFIGASVGGAIAYWVQGKGFPYHGYPMVACGLLAVSVLATADNLKVLEPKRVRYGIGLLIGLFAAANFGWFARQNQQVDYSALFARVGPHPSMLLIGRNMGITHPLVREVDGRWSSRLPAMLATAHAIGIRTRGNPSAEELAQLARYEDREVRIVAEDICRHMPDLIFVSSWDPDFTQWLPTKPTLTPLLQAYRRALETPAGPVLQIESRERLSAACH